MGDERTRDVKHALLCLGCMQVLAVAMHNHGIELEFLHLNEAASRAYQAAGVFFVFILFYF